MKFELCAKLSCIPLKPQAIAIASWRPKPFLLPRWCWCLLVFQNFLAIPSQDCHRHVWWRLNHFYYLDDVLLHQHHLGNRNGSVFTTHAYDNIVKELQENFEKPIDKQKVKNHIKTIKYNWSDCYDVFKNGLSGFASSPITKCGVLNQKFGKV